MASLCWVIPSAARWRRPSSFGMFVLCETGRMQAAVVRNGEDAGSRSDAIIVDNHGTIVEWGVLEENVLDELGIDIGIDGFTRIFNVNQRHLLPDDDESSNEVLAHVVASTNNLHDGWIFLLTFHVLPRKEFQERIEPVVGTQGEEKSTDIFLKQDDKCQHTHADEFVEDAAEEFHLQHLRNDNPHDDEHQNAVKHIQ